MASKTNTTSYQGTGGTNVEDTFGDTGKTKNAKSSGEGDVVSSLDEALRVLDRAIIENKDELEKRLSDDFQDLKTALADFGPQVTEGVRQYGSQAIQTMQSIGREGLGRTRAMASSMDNQVRTSPWLFIGGAAASSLLLGFVLGRVGSSEMES